MWLWLCSPGKRILWHSEFMCCRFKCGKWRWLWDLCAFDYVAVFFLNNAYEMIDVSYYQMVWNNFFICYCMCYFFNVMLPILAQAQLFYFFILFYIWIGTTIVELMCILCFYWDIFMYIARTRKKYADDGCRTPWVWVCWTYMLLMIVLNYLGCQWPITFVCCITFFLTFLHEF